MLLAEAMEISDCDHSKKICRECNYRPYHYMALYFISRKGILKIVDLDFFPKKEMNAPIQTCSDEINDWMVY